MKYYLAILLSLLVVLAACSSETVTETPAETAPAETAPVDTAEETNTGATGPSEKIEIHRREFMPDSLKVAVGTTVTWINTDSMGHTINFRGNSKLGGIVPPGQTHEVVFTEAGTYEYINAAMASTGTIIVE